MVWIENKAKHLPDLMNFKSFIDVVSLCNFCLLANVLDHNTYQFPMSKGRKPTTRELRLRVDYDYNAISPIKRQYFTYICGLAINFLRWTTCVFGVVCTGEKPLEGEPDDPGSIAAWYLQEQAQAIMHYKQKAEEQKVPGINNCKAADVKRQLLYLFNDSRPIPLTMDFKEEVLSEFETFSFSEYNWQMCKLTSPINFVGKS